MAKKKTVRKKTRTSAAQKATVRRSAVTKRRKTARRRPKTLDPLVAAITGADCRELCGVRIDSGRTGAARVKRMIYPAGFRWSVDMKPRVGTDLCMHAHVGFLARGEIHIEYPDGCVVEYRAPQILAIEPGHDGWVIGREPAVLIEFDFEGETIRRLGMPEVHRHP